MASNPPPPLEEDDSSLDTSIDDDSVAVEPSVIVELDDQSTDLSTVSCANRSITTTSSASSGSVLLQETSGFNSELFKRNVLLEPDAEDVLDWNDCSLQVWNEERPLKDLQNVALTMSTDPDICRLKVAFFARTGYGKTHFVRVLGCLLGGVVVIIVPLLSLSADQIKKMLGANNDHGSVEAHHLDECSDSKVKGEIIPRIKEIAENEETTSTMFLFVSPQFLTSNPELVEALVHAHNRRVLRGLGIDEVHLYVGHSQFRLEIRALKDLIWLRFFPPDKPSIHPNYFVTTATITPYYINMLVGLTGIPLKSECFLWPDADHFERENIDIQLSVSMEMTAQYKAMLAELERTSTGRVVIFVTSATDCDKIRKKVEALLNGKGLNHISVIPIHGQQDAVEKFYSMRAFGEEVDPESDFIPRVGVFTGAANTGFDIPDLAYIVRKGFPMDLLTFFQELGRLAREDGSSGIYHVIGTIQSYLQTMKLIHNPDKSDDGIDTEHIGKGSLIRLKRQDREESIGDSNIDDDGRQQPTPNLTQYKPDAKETKEWQGVQTSQALNVLQFCCLGGDCKHAQAATFMSTGKLQFCLGTDNNCISMCPVCRNRGRDWFKIFRRVYKSSLIKWLQSTLVQDAMPLRATYNNNGNALTDLLWNDDASLEEIFGAKKNSTIKKYHVEGLFLQLIAAQIFILKVTRKGSEMKWIFNREKQIVHANDTDGDEEDVVEEEYIHCYKIDKYWTGVSVYPPGKKRRVQKTNNKKKDASKQDTTKKNTDN